MSRPARSSKTSARPSRAEWLILKGSQSFALPAGVEGEDLGAVDAVVDDHAVGQQDAVDELVVADRAGRLALGLVGVASACGWAAVDRRPFDGGRAAFVETDADRPVAAAVLDAAPAEIGTLSRRGLLAPLEGDQLGDGAAVDDESGVLVQFLAVPQGTAQPAPAVTAGGAVGSGRSRRCGRTACRCGGAGPVPHWCVGVEVPG